MNTAFNECFGILIHWHCKLFGCPLTRLMRNYWSHIRMLEWATIHTLFLRRWERNEGNIKRCFCIDGMVFMKDVLCQVNRHSGFSCIWNLLSWKRPLLICENQAQNPAGYTFFFHHQIKTCSCWVHVNQLPGLLLAMFISPVKKGKRGSTDPFG